MHPGRGDDGVSATLREDTPTLSGQARIATQAWRPASWALASWARALGRSRGWDLLDTLLRGWAAAVFWDRAAVGLAVLLLVFLNPWAGATSLLASVAATATAVALRTHPYLLKTGLYGLNGALVGLVAAWYVPSHPYLLPVVAVAAALTVPLTSLWINRVSVRTQLPVLTVPFLVVSWLMFAALRSLQPSLSAGVYYQLGWTNWLEAYVWAALPHDITLFLRSLSWLFFQDSALLGAVAFGFLLLRSRVVALFTLCGYLVGLTIARTLNGAVHAQESLTVEMVVAFNAAFIAACLGGFFLRLSWGTAFFALVGAAVGSLVGLALAPLLEAARLPLLNGPFLVVTLLLLALARSRFLNLGKAGIEAVSLDRVSTPEALLEVPWSGRKADQLRLTLPFYGVWYVAQGTHGLLTHWGSSSFAWDFIVVDRQAKSCRGLGRKADDYHAFGLPVIAPAPGVVVQVVDRVRDNTPPEVNKKENWGNYVIIDHGGDLYSELSHFRRKGIAVKEGDKVVRGELLGYLGNSGMSMEPHLHYQLQRSAFTGAKTVPAKFWGYYRHKGGRAIFVAKGTPQQGDLVGGPKLDIPGKANGRGLGEMPLWLG